MAQREGDLVRAVIQYINARGGFAWRNQSGTLLAYTSNDEKARAIRMGVAGLPDVIGVVPRPALPLDHGVTVTFAREFIPGQLIAVECKRKGNKPTTTQEHVMAALRARGALVVVAYDIRDVEEALR